MSNEVDICNLALSHLGDVANISSIDPPENSVQAMHCARFYPIARNALLEMANWSFAMRRIALTPLSVTNDQWQYVYAKPNLMLRLYIQGGGCSGFQYGFTFDENLTEGDAEIVTDGVKLLVDPMSLQYLVGGSVDYTEGLEGSRFTVTNPNASTTCGCGSSFSI